MRRSTTILYKIIRIVVHVCGNNNQML